MAGSTRPARDQVKTETLTTPVIPGEGVPQNLNQALRDFRVATNRNPMNGEGVATDSLVGLLLGFVIIDSLSGSPINSGPTVRWAHWYKLLSGYGLTEEDVSCLLTTRQSLLYGYGFPKPLAGRQVYFTRKTDAPVVDFGTAHQADISVPSFVQLVEGLAAASRDRWTTALTDNTIRL